MSTPPNPPSTPAGPPAEPAGTPTPETDSIPAPAQPLSLEKAPTTPAAPEAPETSEAPTEPLSLDKTPTTPATPETPETSEAPTEPLSLDKTPTTPATPETPETSEAPTEPLSLDTTPTIPTPPETPAATQAPQAPQAPAAAAPEPARAPSPFAPPSPSAPTPAPAAAGFGTPGAPSHPWGEPTPGYPGTTYPGYPGYPQATPNNNGLAVAAVITGGFGIFLGIIPFLFWAGTLTAAVGVGLGIGGIVRANKGAPRKSMAVVGTVLAVFGLLASVGGFFLTVLVVDRADSRIDRQVEEDWGPDGDYPSSEPWPSKSSSPSKSPSPSQVPGLTSALPFGQTFTYPNGVKVSLATPTKYEAKDELSRKRFKNAVQLTITITNTSNAPHEVIYAMPSVRDDQGMTADMVIDSGGVPKMISGAIMPGETASGIVAFELPKGTKSITADISAGSGLSNVRFAGPIG
ncbi:DUF4352 domain-containing protein [Streptomyces sp. NBC_01214]|uniref:DUF4352 domain-containing protein n=1 Tax=Streptomyces sp. NBC_01214 TaxID=2903777 RepID=UPI00225167BE|nr:DUF4352 domain-containing protein [Streptomyces sp. NBC_01214]MCX4801948.1 DUF4352 domain-containing protein [Streptomyces sp. NBC_01214]